jgi:hypothetical protein
VFVSNNLIKKFSLDIINSIYEDLSQEVDLFISSGNIKLDTTNQYKLIVDDLSLYDDIIYIINSYYEKLQNQGILIMNILGGSTLDELIQSMMHADLYENRIVKRTLPKISAEGLLSLTSNASFSYRTVMSNITKLENLFVRDIIDLLRDIKLTKILLNNPTSKKYWQLVQEIFSSRYHNLGTLEVITFFAVK